ncbi:MAG: heparinase II/III family protein, partial [Desulfobulbaceae bacterium]|nr:heparinase II/III family protein [Desulfobulbaceae bacterium]
VQIYGRIWRKLYRPRIDSSPAPLLRSPIGLWGLPAPRKPSLLSPSLFHFLGEARDLAELEKGWDDPSVKKLWCYNLHYFDDLNAEGNESRLDWHRNLLIRWVQENPPGIGTGWEPYPTSLRIVNWLKWVLSGNELPAECLSSLAVQVRWLRRRLEKHLLGNHLFANAKALVFAGLFFKGAEAERWLGKGLAILSREMSEQILGDGGQFERSTMYHALALEDLLDLCNVVAVYPDAVPGRYRFFVDRWPVLVERMEYWLAVMSHPDGEIGFFNDAAFGIASQPDGLAGYAARLGMPSVAAASEGVTFLKESGYVRLQHASAVVLLDAALLGPDYLPGHAHADTLSFEFSLFGRRVLVNSGISCYGTDGERLRQRGTAAHNTVVVDGEDSSQVWSGFRVAQRAYPSAPKIGRQGQHLIVEASHNGYRRLRGRNRHCRRWELGLGCLRVEDEVTGPFRDAEARFHLHPDVKVESAQLSEGRVVLVLPEGQRVDFVVEIGILRLDSTTWHPRFGESVPNVCLAVQFCSPTVKVELGWQRELE